MTGLPAHVAERKSWTLLGLAPRIARRIAGLFGGGAAAIVLACFGLALAGSTGVVMMRAGIAPEAIYAVLAADLVYIVVLLGMIGLRLWRLMAERRRSASGARLHLRLTGIFVVMALAPTIIIGAYATISVSVGFETWFSQPVGQVVRNSLITAQAYAEEHRRSIERDALGMASELNRAGVFGIGDLALADLLRKLQALRRIPEAYLIDGAGNILHRGDFSYTFTYDRPSGTDIAEARLGKVVVVEDQENNELRALVYLDNYIDTFLYVTRQVDGNVLLLLDETQATVALYNQTEAARGRLLSVFALVYVGFALIVITTAAWLGIWLAERLSRPIGALADAAEQIGAGDLDRRVAEENTGDEIGLLSRSFNRMTAQLKRQRDQLVSAKEESEIRRSFMETVLSGVSAGVIGLDRDGRVEMMNAAARRMLETGKRDPERPPVEAEPIFAAARRAFHGAAQGQVTVPVGEAQREFLVRVAARSQNDPGQGYVMTLDDLTALVSAQREAAWGDVARRIAHEIKNPLTPIQLSAERLRRKFAPLLGEERAAFEQYAEVIVRQAGDIRRMVDEFSRFARMPSPEAKTEDVARLLRDATLLQREARPDLVFDLRGADQPLTLRCDGGMISQALTNLIKNAVEAIDDRIEAEPAFAGKGRVVAALTVDGETATLAVEDNGVGLPKSDRSRLAEPYVTTREKGTGLGLAIVKKIAEQHGGALRLETAMWDGAEAGARVAIVLPRRGPAAEPEQGGA